jgi:parallel beta-helix repeat protein
MEKKICSLIVFWVGLVVNATTFYVSPSGNNSNSGSYENPFRTISYGISRLKAGDIMYVRDGTYNERIYEMGASGTAANPILIKAFPGESPVIDGKGLSIGSGSALIMFNHSYYEFDGFEVKNSPQSGIVFKASSVGCVVRNCVVHDMQQHAVLLLGDQGTAEYITAYNLCLDNENGKSGLEGGWGSGISACRSPKDCIIRHCIVHDCWGEGISTYEATFTRIEDNTVYNTYSAGIYVSDATDCLVQRNFIYSTPDYIIQAMGIGLSDEKFNPASSNNVVINNIVYNCNRNLGIGPNQTNLVVCNNTLVNARATANVIFWNAGELDLVFKNNIVIQENSLECVISASPLKEVGNNLYNKNYDSDARGPGDVVGNPFFAGTENSQSNRFVADFYKLSAKSNAINKGIKVEYVLNDFFGNTRDNVPDIGAHEYSSSVDPVKVTEIRITSQNGSSSISNYQGTLQLNATIMPPEASGKSILWSLTNGTGQATISASGLVTAISNGSVTALATVNDGSGVKGTFIISISNQDEQTEPLYLKSIVVNTPTINLELYFNLTLADIVPGINCFYVTVNSKMVSVKSVSVDNKIVRLELSGSIYMGDIVTVTYIQPETKPLQTQAGGKVPSFIDQPVINNVSIVNKPPSPVITYNSESYSGFIGKIDASKSFDENSDRITFVWKPPNGVPVSSLNSSSIEFLGPIVKNTKKIEFVLEIHDSRSFVSKTIVINITPYKHDLDSATIINSDASCTIGLNAANKAFDGDLTTSWAADEINATLTAELENPFFVDHFKIAFLHNHGTEYLFDIFGSSDGLRWDELLKGSKSCSFSGDLQVFELPKSKADKGMRYIKFIGKGNSKDNWSYISELKVYGKSIESSLSLYVPPVKIFPNPAKQYINVHIKDQAFIADFIQIVAMSGLIMANSILDPLVREFTLPLSLKKGSYILQFISGSSILYTQKLIIQ